MLTLRQQYITTKHGDIMLDLGCGEGRHMAGLLESEIGVNVIGVDLRHQDLMTAKNKIRSYYPEKFQQSFFIEANGYHLPFANNSFDHIVCSEVLEHIEEYALVLEEIYRILKPGGQLCISVPRTWPEKICWFLSREYHQVKGGHLRIFNASALKNKIQSLGFKAYRRHWAHALHSPFWWLKCAFWGRGDNFLLTRWYHKMLVWDLMKKPALTHYIEKALNPLMGKSVVFYFEKLKSRD